MTKKSFTLIEVLIGIVVVGILSSFIIVSISSFVDDANDTKRKKDLDSIATSLLAYKTLTGSYPIEPFDCNIGDEEDTCLDELIESGYATNFPIDPDGTRYTYTSDGTTYTIRASLSNNQTLTYNPDTGYSEYQGVAGLEGYDRRKPITVTSTASLTNYQMKFIVHRSPGTDLGPDVFVDSNCQEDYDDIRFTNSSNQTLDYWIESSDSSSATIWVEVDSLASGDTTLYLYYDNSSETTAVSNGENTFEFFDDWSNGSLDIEKFVAVGGYSISDGVISQTNSNYIMIFSKYQYDVTTNIIRARSKYSNTGVDYGMSGGFCTANTGHPAGSYRSSIIFHSSNVVLMNCYQNYSVGVNAVSGDDPANNTDWYITEIRKSGSTNILSVTDLYGTVGSTTYSSSSTSISNNYIEVIAPRSGLTVYNDWILLRKYTSSEPTASWGSEEPL